MGTNIAAAGTIGHGMARMVGNRRRAASIAAAVAAASTIAHGVACMMSDRGRHAANMSIQGGSSY